MKKRVTILLFVLLVAGAWVVSNNLYPYSKLEVWVLHQMYDRGSGWDDAAADIVMRNPNRYAPQIRRMLDRAEPGSADEAVALVFVEFVIEEPGVREALQRRGESHPDQRTADLISAILDGPPRTIPIYERDGVSVKILVPDTAKE